MSKKYEVELECDHTFRTGRAKWETLSPGGSHNCGHCGSVPRRITAKQILDGAGAVVG